MRQQLPARALPRQGPGAYAALSALPPSAEAKRKIASVAVDGCGFMSHPVEEQYVCTAGLAGDDSFFFFYKEILIPEARCFISIQMLNESIHAEMYALQIEAYVTNPEEKDKLMNFLSYEEHVG